MWLVSLETSKLGKSGGIEVLIVAAWPVFDVLTVSFVDLGMSIGIVNSLTLLNNYILAEYSE